MGGAVAPFAATALGERVDPALPYIVGALACAVAMGVLVTRRHHMGALRHV
jgi:hypothetical protein